MSVLQSMSCFFAHASVRRAALVQAETMTSKDAYMFPVIGSCVLFGLYMLFKIFSKEYINMLLTAYFLLFGVIGARVGCSLVRASHAAALSSPPAVTTTLAPVLHSLMPPAKDTKPWEYKIHFPWDMGEPRATKRNA